MGYDHPYAMKRFDPRFEDAGIEIDEYTLQAESDVLGILDDLPYYYRDTPDFKEQKKTVLYGFWTRPTIPWSLDCDNQYGKSRKDALKVIRSIIDL